MSRTRFVEINPFGAELVKMQLFARSFDHHIVPRRGTQTLALQRGEIVFGYVDVVMTPIAFPAFHPGVTTPRDVVDALDGWKTHCQFAHGGEGLLGVPLPDEPGRKNFPEEVIADRGFIRQKREIYALDPER